MSEVESINPNTPITSNLNKSGAIETSGPVDWNDLEELTSKSKKSDKKEEPKKEKSKDLSSDDQKGKKETKSEKKPEKTESKSKEETETSEATEKPRKTVKAKFNDSELELDEEALVPVTINGKEELVQVKDLLGNYSGKTVWEKKFSEIDKTRKSVAAQELKLRETSDMIKSVYEEQDPNLKMFRMAQLAGVDPVEFRTKFFNDNISLLEKYYNMSEDERKADALSYEASIHKHRADTLEKANQEKQAFDELQSKVADLRARHEISEQEFVEKYDGLVNQAKMGHIDPKLVTPEYIINSVQVDRLWSAAASKVDELGLDWNEQTRNQNLQKFVMNAHQLGLKPNDMAEMVDELWGIKKAQKKIEAKKQENKEFIAGKKDVQQVRAEKPEVWSFDQI